MARRTVAGADDVAADDAGGGVAAVGHQMGCSYGIEVAFGD